MEINPQYGYTDEYRQKILAYAEKTSLTKAAQQFNVGRTSIRHWSRIYER